jgi:hypothetical protein
MVVGVVVLIVILAIIAPKRYDVKRTIGINKPLPEVFSYLKYLKNQSDWSPWEGKDPNMEKSFSGTDGEVGFVSSWSGNKEVGVGEQEITNIVKNELVQTQLRFLKPFKSTSNAYLQVIEEGDCTKVIWGFRGKNKFPVSIMMLFMNIDKQVGKDFESGLQKLKTVIEA